MLKDLFRKFMRKSKTDYRKEEVRGIIKEIMKTRGLRSISVSNYQRWKNDTNDNIGWLHSIKMNIEDGYLHFHAFGNKPTDRRAGDAYTDVSMDMYLDAYSTVKDILKDEPNMNSKIKRNILVKVDR